MKPIHRNYTSDAASRLIAVTASEITPYRRFIVDGLKPQGFDPKRGPFDFADLMEIRILALLRAHPKIGARGAHMIAEEARRSTGLTRPLSDPTFPERAQRTARRAGLKAQLDVARITEVVGLIERDKDGEPTRWKIGADALGNPGSAIALDPELHPHAPVATPSEITIHEIAYLRRFLETEAAATRLGISAEQVRDAVRLESTLHIIRSLRDGWDYHHRLGSQPPGDGCKTPGTAAAEDYETVPEPMGRRSARLTHAGISSNSRMPFINPSIHDWMSALNAAAPTIGELTSAPPLRLTAMMTEQHEVHFTFELSADPDEWIRGQGSAWLQPSGSTGHPDRPADATADMILYSEQYPVHEHILRSLPPSEPNLERLRLTFRQWVQKTYPHTHSMNPPVQPVDHNLRQNRMTPHHA